MAGPRDMTTIVGIDLGTTNTSVAAVSGTKVSVLAPGPGLRSFPSVVSLPNPREVLVGLAARARLATDPSRTIASPKRLLGRKHAEREVQSFVGAAPYPTRAGADGTTVIEIDGEGYAVPQLVAHLLAEAKAVAERHLGSRSSTRSWRCRSASTSTAVAPSRPRPGWPASRSTA
jgi:molecular chaperone DnaK